MGGDYWYNMALAEELSRIRGGAIPMAMGVQTDMATPALNQYGSHELKKKFLEPAIRGDAVCSIAVTEAGAGSDVAAIRTKAERDGDHYVINGSKMFITNGAQADWLCLLARTTPGTLYKGMSLIIVPTDTPGFSVSKKLKKMGNWASDTAELVFDNVRVPVSNRIGEEGQGFIYQMQQFQNERLISALGRGGRRGKDPQDDDRLLPRSSDLRQAADRKPVDLLQADRAAHRSRVPAADVLPLRPDDGPRRGLHARSLDGQAQGRPAGARSGRHLHAIPRRHGLHGRVSDGPLLSATRA